MIEDFPTTGDFVLINPNPSGDSQIIKRWAKVVFSWRDPTRTGEQAAAANFDYVFIMQSLNFTSTWSVWNVITLAWQSGALPVVILTKTDLVADYSEQMEAVQKVAIGAGVHAISALTGDGLDELKDYLKPRKTIVFLGSSGVGKSSLVNTLAGEELMAVNEIKRRR